jgi:hypothetical protein
VAFGTIRGLFIFVKVGARSPRPHLVGVFPDSLKSPDPVFSLYSMAWGAYMLCKPLGPGFHWFRVKESENPYRFEMMHRTWENPTTVNREHQHGAKEKILLKEGVDLKRINDEYQEKKGYFKEKQETKISNQEPGADSDIDGDEIINVSLSGQLNREWNQVRWYSLPSIASKPGIHRNTVVYWRDFGIKVNGSHIRLKMVKRPFQWYSKGKWIIKFFLKTNIDVDMK